MIRACSRITIMMPERRWFGSLIRQKTSWHPAKRRVHCAREMRFKLIRKIIAGWLLAACVVLAFGAGRTEAKDMKIEIQLLWGTTNSTSPNPNYKEVKPDVRKKLKDLPLKWNKYFLVNRKMIVVPPNKTVKEPLSEKCAIEVKNAEHSTVEVTLYGKGKDLLTRTQALPKGEILALGGNAPNATSWLVVLKRIE